MSFYGNQYLEFTDIFHKFLLKCSGHSDDEWSITPDAKFDTFIIDAANPWIDVQPYSDNNTEKGVAITHRLREDFDVQQLENQKKLITTQSLKEVNEEEYSGDEPPSLGEHGEYIEANKLKIDEAGHVLGIESVYYKLPSVAELDNRITTESAARENGDNILLGKINETIEKLAQEVIYRESEDAALQNSINSCVNHIVAEIEARKAGDAALLTQLTWKNLSEL